MMKVVRLAMVMAFTMCLATAAFGQTSGANNDLEAVQQGLSCNPGAGWFNRPYSRHYIVDYQRQQTPCPAAMYAPAPAPVAAPPCVQQSCPPNCQNCVPAKQCQDAKCPCCHMTCPMHGMDCKQGCERICPLHGKACTHACLGSQFGYGANSPCPPPGCGPCAIHGYGPCPGQGGAVRQGLRNFFRPSNEPYFGMNPLMARQAVYGQAGYGPGYGMESSYPVGYGGGPGCFESRFPKLHGILAGQPMYNNVAPPEPMKTYTTRGPRDFLCPNPPSIGY